MRSPSQTVAPGQQGGGAASPGRGIQKFDFDFREGGGRRRTGSDGLEDDRDGLPEWCTDEEDGEMGTFDASGAFLPISKKGGKDEEFDFQGIEEEEEEDEEQEGLSDMGRILNGGEKADTKASASDGELKNDSSPPSSASPPAALSALSAPPALGLNPSVNPPMPEVSLTVAELEASQMATSHPLTAPVSVPAKMTSEGTRTVVLPAKMTSEGTRTVVLPAKMTSEGTRTVVLPAKMTSEGTRTVVLPTKMTSEVILEGSPAGGATTQLSPSSSLSLPSTPPTSAATHLPPPSGGDTEDDEGMKHLQQEAEKMVASLQDTSLEDECFTQTLQESRNTAAALPLSHDAAMKWFYKDPQGEIQGPFTTLEMGEWFQAGYFTMTLLVKRGCDQGFQQLGDVIKMWGRVPFAPGPSPPPLLVRPPPPRPLPPRGPAGNMDQDRLKKQQQQDLTAAALYQQLQQQQQLFQLINSCGDQGMMPSVNRSMSVPDTESMWDMHTSASQQSGGEASLWDLTMNSSTQVPTLEQLQKERREVELRAKREEEEQRKRREERRKQEEQKRREEEELFRRKQCRQQQELIMKLLQQAPQQASGWGTGGSTGGLNKPGAKGLSLLDMQEAERLLKQQQRAQQQRERHQGLSMGGSSMGQWSDGGAVPGGLWGGAGGVEAKTGGGVLSGGGIGLWDEVMKNQARSGSMQGLKNSRSSPSLSEQYMLSRRKQRTEDEDKLLKLLQGIKTPQDGFTTWCEQMLHALNTQTNNTSSPLDVSTIVAYLKEVESPYEVLDFIRSYLGDTMEAKEFAKQFLERRAKQKQNHQRQQQQLSKEVSGLTMNNFPLQDSMRGMNPSALQSMFQAAQMSKGGMYDVQGSMKKKHPGSLHSDPSILGTSSGYSFHNAGERLSLNEMEMVEDY
ncbi:hypothetical protein UPYG_G00238950 [Umbra pygmaea]|uniref:GYF domain-containing protein n=1 Tax=Umbra pygmaea TaxID=75934 RepID=A0ABD0WJR8_UMBPY